MGSVYRKTVTKPLPEDAKIFTRDGERFARWQDSRGKTHKAPVKVGRKGADRIEVKVKTYTAKYRDGSGILREVPTKCRDELAARSVLADLERRAELVKANVMTAGEDVVAKHRGVSLEDHIEAYITHQRTKGLNKVRISNTKARLKKIAADRSLVHLSDMTAATLEQWLLARKKENMSPGTRNAYREALVAFGNWCVRTGRLLENPVASVPKANTKVDCRRKRRALTEDELERLLDATRRRPLSDATMIRSGPNRGRAIARISDEKRRKLELLGRERALIYKTYVLTGLRKSELASLTIAQLQLDGTRPFLDLAAADEKNREGSEIPLRRDLADELAKWVAFKGERAKDVATIAINGQDSQGLPGDTLLFKIPSGFLRILNRDLKFAGIPKVDERGRSVDLHALRHTFGTHLSKGGVAPRTAQAAMRHSSIDLTMNVYTDPKLLDVHGALDALPGLPLDAELTVDQQTAATGTHDLAPRQFVPEFAPTTYNSCKSVSFPDNCTTDGQAGVDPETLDVSPVEVNGKEPLSIVDNGSQQSGRLDLNQRPLRPERSAPHSQRQDIEQVTEDGLPVCTRVCTSNTDFGNDAAAPDKSLDPRLQLLIERWPTLSKAVQQQIMLLVG